MAKNAFDRYQLYDKLFRDKNVPEGYCWEAISDKLDEENKSVSQQMFNRDLNVMEKIYFHGEKVIDRITKKDKKTYFTYKDKSISINFDTRTTEAIAKLAQIQGLGIDTVVDDLCDIAGIQRTDNSVISYDTVVEYHGIEHLISLYEYIVGRKVLKIEYKPNFETKTEVVVHPYHLRRYNDRWFLFGWCVSANPMPNLPQLPHLYNIPLDRIISIQKDDREYESAESHNISFVGEDDYYYDVIGVTKYENEPTNKIRLKFAPKRFKYVETKPLHPSQKIVNRDNGTITINVSRNNELDALILSFGKDVEVVGPPIYRDHIKEIIKAQMAQYED